MRNLRGRDLARKLLLQDPYMEPKTLSDRVFEADKSSYPYRVTLLFVGVLRWGGAVGLILSAAVGQLLSDGVQFSSGFDLIIMGVIEAKRVLLIDLLFVVAGVLAFRSNPKSMSLTQILESDSWSRCRPRVGIFLFWSMFPYMFIILAAILSNL